VEFTEVIRRRRMIRAFTAEPLAAGTTERLLQAATRAPSAGFSQGYSFLVLEGLGAVFFGIPPENTADFHTQFGVPEQWTPIGAIAIGHPDPASDLVPPARPSDRKSLEELGHRGRW
jgi:nitroreductase